MSTPGCHVQIKPFPFSHKTKTQCRRYEESFFLSSVKQVLSILYSKWIPVPQCALSQPGETLEVLYVWSGNEGLLWWFQGIELCRRIDFNEPTRTISPSKYLLCTSTPARQAVFWHIMRWMSHKLFSQVVLFPSLPPPLLKCSKA